MGWGRVSVVRVTKKKGSALNAPRERSLLKGKRLKNPPPRRLGPSLGCAMRCRRRGAAERAAPSPCLHRADGTGDIFPKSWMFGSIQKRVLRFPEELQGLWSTQNGTAGADSSPWLVHPSPSLSRGTCPGRWAWSSHPAPKNPPLEKNWGAVTGAEVPSRTQKGIGRLPSWGAPHCSLPVGAVL